MDEDLEAEGLRSDGEPASDQEQTAVPTVAVVGIGASAGGSEEVRLLLADLPADTGLAIVFIQHLDPTHESSLTGILGVRPQCRLRRRAMACG
jgi:two-component system CheB/CheR fusion protein